MGIWFEFACRDCGYRARVSGGEDMGMIAVTRTMTCLACRELVDVVVGREGRVGPTGDPDFDAALGRCGRCEGTDLAPWAEGDPCPKCGGTMERDPDSFVLWD